MRFGPYELEERLAVGGMAEVFLAVRAGAEGFRRRIVLKRILPQFAEDADFQTLFADEARLGGLLHHPNIVQMFDYDRVDGVAYLAMEYVAGRDLGYVLKHGPRMPLQAALFVVLEVLEGLGYAHDLTDGGRPLHIVHRDISPANILLSYAGEVKIADLGVARADTAAHQTTAGALKGKIPYLSPEQVAAQPADARSDLFSLSVVLYQMLTGSRPFDATSEMEVLQRIAFGDFLAPTRIAPDLPSVLEPVIMKGLATDRAKRFQTAAELGAALRAAAASVGLAPSADALREHLSAHFTGRATVRTAAQSSRSGVSDDAPTIDAAHASFVPVPDAATGYDGPTVPDRKIQGSTPRPEVPRAPDPGTRQTSRASRRSSSVALIVAGALAVLGAALALLAGLPDWLAGGAGEPAAHRAAPPWVIVWRMTDQQEGWALRHLVRPFIDLRHERIRLVRFRDVGDLPRALRDAGPTDLVKVPLPVARALVDSGLVRSITRLVDDLDLEGGLSAVTSGFEPRAIRLCEYPTIVGRELFFLPRKEEVRVLVYRREAVRAAVAAFPALRASLEADLVRLHGQGLPDGFVLEDDPEEWDWYDLLAVAYAMARTPDDRGRTMPRVARRVHPYWGTVGTTLDMLRALGQADPAIEPSQQMIDFVAWEAAYRELGLYHSSMYRDEEVLSGRGLYEAMQRGDVHLTTTHSLGVRLLVGSPDAALVGYVPDGETSLGLSTLPRGVSFALDSSGKPLRLGRRGGLVDGWLWGIPASAPDPVRSLALLRHLTSRESAIRETRAFYLQPVRTDVALDGDPLALRLAAVIAAQMQQDEGALVPRPADPAELDRMRDRAVAVWRELIVAGAHGDSGRIDEGTIANELRAILR
ncbi:MAG: protein kinase [Deltaproteobacteria bacterium]|nr:protein kinase [Deltaproteobacteria bacterium]